MIAAANPVGIVGNLYVGHFDKPLAHARHYVGYTSREPKARWAEHETGKGSKLVRAAKQHGIIVTWHFLGRGTRNDERRLHNRKGASQFCPTCKEARA